VNVAIESQMSCETAYQGASFYAERVSWAVCVLVLTAAAVVLGLPMLIYGPMVNGHDTYQHLNYSQHFATQFWEGEWYPRWLLGINHGLGSPSLYIYPPFASYVTALLQPVGSVLHFNSFKVAEFLALLGSGWAAFLWMRTLVSRALISA